MIKLHLLTLVGEENEAFLIRMRKPLPSRHVDGDT